MDIVRFYEATIHDQEHGLAASIIVLPSSYLPDYYDPANPSDILSRLQIELVGPIRAGQLIPALASVLSPDARSSITGPESQPYWTIQPSRESLAFAEFVVVADHVPFENSPLSGDSLGNLIAQATGVGLGAFVGFALTAGTPLVLIAVPGGMILCGAAAGIARGLEEGLRDAVRRRVKDALMPSRRKRR